MESDLRKQKDDLMALIQNKSMKLNMESATLSETEKKELKRLINVKEMELLRINDKIRRGNV